MELEETQILPGLYKCLRGEDFNAQSNVKCAKVEDCFDKGHDVNLHKSSAKVSGCRQLELDLSDCTCMKDSDETASMIISHTSCNSRVHVRRNEASGMSVPDNVDITLEILTGANDVIQEATHLSVKWDFDKIKYVEKGDSDQGNELFKAINEDTVSLSRQEIVPIIANNCNGNAQVFGDKATNKCIGMKSSGITKQHVEDVTRTVLNEIINDIVRNDTNLYVDQDRSRNEGNNALDELPFKQQELDINIYHNDKLCTKDKSPKDIPSYGLPWIPYRIWICGSSIVFWAAKSTDNYHTGKHLGLDGWGVSIDWKGWRGMQWKNLVPWINKDLPKAIKQKCKPDMLIIHLGSNDLVSVETHELINSIKDDFSRLRDMLPNVTLVWSTMLPRLCWRGTENVEEAERSRQVINNAVNDHVVKLGGKIIKHFKLESADEDFFIWDGVHLSEYGNEIFLNAIQRGLELFTTSEEVIFPYIGKDKPASANNL